MKKVYKFYLDPPLRDLRNKRRFETVEVVAQSKKEAYKRLDKVSNVWCNKTAPGKPVKVEVLKMPLPNID